MNFAVVLVFLVCAISLANASVNDYAGSEVLEAQIGPSTLPLSVNPAPSASAFPRQTPDKAMTNNPRAQKERRMCWVGTRRCCWVERRDGYECRDNYDMNMARCHQKYKHVRKCRKINGESQARRPEGRINYVKCDTVSYDKQYGAHIDGYPSGMSEPYHTKKLPTKPYKVDVEKREPGHLPNAAPSQLFPPESAVPISAFSPAAPVYSAPIASPAHESVTPSATLAPLSY